MAQTYRDLVTGSLRLLGVIGDGEALTAFQAQNALDTLNEILDLWNTAGLLVYSNDFYTLALTGVGSYTIGPGGSINVPIRPALISSAWIRYNTGSTQTDLPVNILSSSEWGNLRSKNVTSNLPQSLYCDGNWPLANISLWPIAPSGTLVILISTPLNSAVTLDTAENLPPSYRAALRAELAVNCAPEYGREASPTVQLMAIRAKNLIAIANTEIDRLDFDAALLGRPRYWITSDGA